LKETELNYISLLNAFFYHRRLELISTQSADG